MIRVLLTGALLCFIAHPANTTKIDNQKILTRASDLLRAGEVRQAAAAFRAFLKSSLNRHDEHSAAQARVGLAACFLVTHDYKQAVENGEIALRYGLATKDGDLAVRAALNLSSVYRMMGDFAAAAQTMRDLNPVLPQITDPRTKAPLYLHSATNSARTGDWARAEPLFFAGIETAVNHGDMQMAAIGWNQLGYMRLQNNELGKADAALTEAFRIRRLAGNRNLGASYTYLGMLRLLQGDGHSALNLLTRAIDIASGRTFPSPAPPYITGVPERRRPCQTSPEPWRILSMRFTGRRNGVAMYCHPTVPVSALKSAWTKYSMSTFRRACRHGRQEPTRH